MTNPSEPATARRGIKAAVIGIVALFVLVYLVPLGLRPLIRPDEFRYCEIPREMIASGDWIVPHLNGLRYFEKPCLGYWAIAVSMLAFGENAFAARLPSALSVGMSAIFIAMVALRSGRGRKAAILAPAVFITSCQVFGVGTYNVLDTMFSALVTGTMTAFYFWYTEPDRRRKLVFLILFGLACGLAFLVKGILAIAIPAIVIGPFTLWEHRWKEVVRAAWLPIAAALFVSLPWSIAVAIREADFWPYFIWVEHIQRFFFSKDGEHVQSWWYLWAVLLVGTLPWNVFLASIAIGCKRIGLRATFLRFLLCWAGIPLALFLASSSQLGTYILPCYPPMALLIAAGLLYYLESGGMRLLTAGIVITVSLVGLAVLAFVVIRATQPFGLQLFGPTEVWRWALAVISMAVWLVLLIFALRAGDYRNKLAFYCAAPLLAFSLSPLILPREEDHTRMPGKFLEKHGDYVKGNAVVVSDPSLLHAVCWCYRRTDVRLLYRAGELKYGLRYPEAGQSLLSFDDFTDLASSSSAEEPVVLVLTQETYERYKFLGLLQREDGLPKPTQTAAEGGLWIGKY